MGNPELQNLLRTGIQAAQSGNKAVARSILEQVTEQDPANELAWMWLASVSESVAERRRCLQKVLEINPQNERARQALDKLAAATPIAPPSPAQVSAARSTPPLPTPSLRPRADRVAELEREALIRTVARRRRRPSRLFFITGGLLAVVMIAAGLVLLLNEALSNKENTPEPAQKATSGAGLPPVATRPPAFITATPIGGVLITQPPFQSTLPATWTPVPSAPPTLPPPPTPTPIPLADYTLLISIKQVGQAGWALYTLRGDGSDVQPLHLTFAPNGTEVEAGLSLLEVFDAAIAPDGQQIAFTAHLSGTRTEGETTVQVEFTDIFTAPLNGGAMRRLTTFEASNTGELTWSPDGQMLAFASDVDGDYDIYLVGLDGGTPRPLTFNDGEDRYPSWSPDGTVIAFASDQAGPGFLEVWRVEVTGAGLRQLTDAENHSYAPAWSPDGSQIAFLSNRSGDTDLYIMSADGTGERVLTVGDGTAEERDPAWSPDGRWIAVSSNRTSPAFELYLVRPDASAVQQITFGQGDIRFAAWLP